MNLEQELNQLIDPRKNELHGNLGLSTTVVKVSSRPGYVWVRLLGGNKEIIKAHNVKVSSIYDLPVILTFDGIKYEISGVDWDRYTEWRTDSSFLPDHAQQHSALRGAEGNDILWVDSQQYLPLLVTPTTLTGTMGVTIGPYNYLNSSNHMAAVGGTGFYGLNPIHATQSNLYLIMLEDSTGNFYSLTGSVFAPSITGTSDVLQHLPSIPVNSLDRPLAAVKVTPQLPINWNAVYDLRQMYTRPVLSITSLTGAVVGNGPGVTVTTIPTGTITNSHLAIMPAYTLKGNNTGVDARPADLTMSQILSMGAGAFGGAQETVNESADGSRTHFTFTNAALSIWVVVDGVIQKSTDVTFVSGATAFDLAWPPKSGDDVRVIRLAPIVVPTSEAYVLVREEQNSGVSGGTNVVRTWQIRTINTEVVDTNNLCSLPGSNIIRLLAGTYRYRIQAPAYAVSANKARLYNVTVGAIVPNGEGISNYFGGQNHPAGGTAIIAGRVTLDVTSDLRVEHWTSYAVPNDGLGAAVSTGVKEVFTVAEFWREVL